MGGISLLAIIVGGVSDVVLSGLLGVPLGIYVVATHGLARLPKDQLQGALISAIHGDRGLYAAQLVIGLGCSVIGGFIAAWIAKQRRLLNGILACSLCVAIGLRTLSSGNGGNSALVHASLIAATPICYALGALLRMKLSRATKPVT